MRECKNVGGGSITYESERSDTNAHGNVVWSRVGVQPRDVVASALESVLMDDSK